jgi:hypothetical protein
MRLSKDKITEIFVFVDEFCQEFEKNIAKHSLGKTPRKKPKMYQSEVITIMVLFHFGAFRNLKHFYLFYVKPHMDSEFPNTVSYNRFVELLQSTALPMTLFLKTCCLGNCTGISFGIQLRSGFAKTNAYQGIKCLRAWPKEANHPWAISLVSSYT